MASIGPLVGALLVAKIGFWGAFATCAAVYTFAALVFLAAPPSPQRAALPSSHGRCREWAASSTPILLLRVLRTRRLNVLCIAFACAMGGLNGGAVSIVFYGQRYLGWTQQQIGYFIAGFSFLGCDMSHMHVHPCMRTCARWYRRVLLCVGLVVSLRRVDQRRQLVDEHKKDGDVVGALVELQPERQGSNQ